jgi:hypothetical protein
MKKITKDELREIINGVKGTTFVSIDMESEARMRKTGNPYVGATKVVTLSGAIGYDYTSSVNRQLDREGKETNFVAQPRAWGKWENNWIEHKGFYYLPVKVQGASDPIFKYNGAVLEKSTLEPFLQESHKPHTQEALEKEVVVRDVKIDNIRKIRVLGDEFEVI